MEAQTSLTNFCEIPSAGLYLVNKKDRKTVMTVCPEDLKKGFSGYEELRKLAV